MRDITSQDDVKLEDDACHTVAGDEGEGVEEGEKGEKGDELRFRLKVRQRRRGYGRGLGCVRYLTLNCKCSDDGGDNKLQDETKTPCPVNLSPPDSNGRRSAYDIFDEPFRTDIFLPLIMLVVLIDAKKVGSKMLVLTRQGGSHWKIANWNNPRGKLKYRGGTVFFSLKNTILRGEITESTLPGRKQTWGKKQIPGGKSSTITVYGRVSAPRCRHNVCMRMWRSPT